MEFSDSTRTMCYVKLKNRNLWRLGIIPSRPPKPALLWIQSVQLVVCGWPSSIREENGRNLGQDYSTEQVLARSFEKSVIRR